MANLYTVRKTRRTWGVFRADELVEGGFFNRDAALDAAWAYNDADERELNARRRDQSDYFAELKGDERRDGGR